MNRVLVASKSCGVGLGRKQLEDLFRASGMEPVFETLAEGEKHMADFDAVVIGIDKIEPRHFKSGKNIQVVMKFGVGTDNINMKAAQESGVQVLNMPGVNSEAVAEMAFALLMAATRRVVEGDRRVHAGEWPRLLSWSPVGKTLGIVGTGAVGRTLLHLVCGLDMHILGYDAYPNEAFRQAGGRYVSFKELLKSSDYISIHVPLADDTFHMIGEKELSLMKRSAILINTSRGPVIDEKALFEALRHGCIAAAGVDVFEHEPPSGSPLLELDNAICLPHISAYTMETMKKMDRLCVQKLGEALKN